MRYEAEIKKLLCNRNVIAVGTTSWMTFILSIGNNEKENVDIKYSFHQFVIGWTFYRNDQAILDSMVHERLMHRALFDVLKVLENRMITDFELIEENGYILRFEGGYKIRCNPSLGFREDDEPEDKEGSWFIADEVKDRMIFSYVDENNISGIDM